MQDALEARVAALEIAYALLAAKTFRLACYIVDWNHEDWVGFMLGHADELRRSSGPEHIGIIVERIMERLVPGDGEELAPPGTAHRADTGANGAKGK
jgi:hypothetical protein